jgi:hypothetical protein
MPYTPSCETLAVAAFWPISEALATRVVLAHSHVTFHLCTCELRGGVAVVGAALNSYNIVEVTTGMTTRRKQS